MLSGKKAWASEKHTYTCCIAIYIIYFLLGETNWKATKRELHCQLSWAFFLTLDFSTGYTKVITDLDIVLEKFGWP